MIYLKNTLLVRGILYIVFRIFPASRMNQNFLILWSLEIVFEPHYGIHFLLGGHVGILGQSDTEGLHEVSDRTNLGTPGIKVVLQEDVLIEWIVGIVQT